MKGLELGEGRLSTAIHDPREPIYLYFRGCMFAYSGLTRLIALCGSFSNVSGDLEVWRFETRLALLGIRLKLMLPWHDLG